MEIGVYTFAEVGAGHGVSPEQRMRNLLEEMELADQVGLDVFGLGEHHRPDFAVSAPAVALAAGAARTKSIRLTSAVSVLSSDDPVRVFQEFATLDLVSGGRAEIMAGPRLVRGVVPAVRIRPGRLRRAVRREARAAAGHTGVGARHAGRDATARRSTTSGSTRDRCRTRCRSGWPSAARRTPLIRAGRLGLPLALAIIGGAPERFVPLVQLYREALAEAGHAPQPVGINSHAYVADGSQQAADEYFPAYAGMMNRIGRERGWSPMTRHQFDTLRSPRGALVVGGPEEVAEKILFQHELFGHQRFLAQLSVGDMPHDRILRAIELLGTEVAPVVRREVERREAGAATKAPAGGG